MTKARETAAVLDRLAATLAGKRGAEPSESYTAKLLARGMEKCAQKLGEEAVETVIEAIKLDAGPGDQARDRTKLTAESADLLYHLLVVWTAADLDPAEVWDELGRRAGISGLEEKAGRKG
jgi:phosphoribosyl-ATP pyrophosphohydrolase